MTSNPQLFWGLIASMWVGNAMLVILNLPMIGIWIKLLTVPYRFLFPAIMSFCCIGLYTLNNNRSTSTWARSSRSSATSSTSSPAASRRRCCWASSSGR